MTYTPTNWVEGVTTLGPTNMNKIETELAYLDARIPVAAVGYGTSLPGSPVDGQEYVLVDSTTNPTYQWRFRYNASNSTTYKWEFIGGPPVRTTGYVGSGQTVGPPSTWVAGQPSFVLPRAGVWYGELTGQVFGTNAVTFQMSCGAAASSGVAVAMSNLGAGVYQIATAFATATLAAAATFGGMYWTSNDSQVVNMTLAIWPVRVS